MRDEIYYGNLLGLLKNGKWSLSVAEAAALIQIIQETERRRNPAAPIAKMEAKDGSKRVRK